MWRNYSVFYELNPDQIQKDREKGLTVEEILVSVMYNEYNMSVNEIGEVLLIKPQTVRAEYIRATVKKS